jgi:hypothetical protein
MDCPIKENDWCRYRHGVRGVEELAEAFRSARVRPAAIDLPAIGDIRLRT